MKVVVYEAILADPRNLALVQAARPAIEAVGGRIVADPPTKVGMVVVTLSLPAPYHPKQFLPSLPFYPV